MDTRLLHVPQYIIPFHSSCSVLQINGISYSVVMEFLVPKKPLRGYLKWEKCYLSAVYLSSCQISTPWVINYLMKHRSCFYLSVYVNCILWRTMYINSYVLRNYIIYYADWSAKKRQAHELVCSMYWFVTCRTLGQADVIQLDMILFSWKLCQTITVLDYRNEEMRHFPN